MGSGPWERLRPATVKYHENNIRAWVRQPANAWSNMAYVVVGAWLYYQFTMQASAWWMAILPITAILIGLTSFLYHASYSLLFQFSDLVSMYLLAAFLVAFNLRRLISMPDGTFYAVYVTIFVVSCAAFLTLRKTSGFLIFAALALVSILLETLMWVVGPPISRVDYLMAMVVLSVSLVFWIVDYRGKLFDADNHFVQGHALWHVISSLCFVFMYNHYQQFAGLM